MGVESDLRSGLISGEARRAPSGRSWRTKRGPNDDRMKGRGRARSKLEDVVVMFPSQARWHRDPGYVAKQILCLCVERETSRFSGPTMDWAGGRCNDWLAALAAPPQRRLLC